MKRLLTLLISLVLFLASSSALQPAPQPVQQQSAQTKEITVYITRTGKKHHRAGCSYLRSSSIPISLKEAKARGYAPCSRCRPAR